MFSLGGPKTNIAFHATTSAVALGFGAYGIYDICKPHISGGRRAMDALQIVSLAMLPYDIIAIKNIVKEMRSASIQEEMEKRSAREPKTDNDIAKRITSPNSAASATSRSHKLTAADLAARSEAAQAQAAAGSAAQKRAATHFATPARG